MTEDIRQRLLEMIKKGELGKAIAQLAQMQLKGHLGKEIATLSNRYARLHSDHRKGVLSMQEYHIFENQIVAGLVDLLHGWVVEAPSEQSRNEGARRRKLGVFWWLISDVGMGFLVVGFLVGPPLSSGRLVSHFSGVKLSASSDSMSRGSEIGRVSKIDKTLPPPQVTEKRADGDPPMPARVDCTLPEDDLPRLDTDFVLPGMILDSIESYRYGRFPVEGVRVYVTRKGCDSSMVEDVTNAQGRYMLKIVRGSYIPDRIVVDGSKQGYLRDTGNFSLHLKDYNLHIKKK